MYSKEDRERILVDLAASNLTEATSPASPVAPAGGR